MQKALLISILAATVLIPLFASRGGTVKQAVRRSATATAVFCVLSWFGRIFVDPSLPPSKRTPSNPGSSAQ